MRLWRERGFEPLIDADDGGSKEGITGKARQAGSYDSRAQRNFQQFKQQKGLA
jgi:hypothetical protein